MGGICSVGLHGTREPVDLAWMGHRCAGRAIQNLFVERRAASRLDDLKAIEKTPAAAAAVNHCIVLLVAVAVNGLGSPKCG